MEHDGELFYFVFKSIYRPQKCMLPLCSTATDIWPLTAILYSVAGGIHGLGTYIIHGSCIPIQYSYGMQPY